MNVKQALREGATLLMGASQTPNLDAELLLSWIYDWDRIQIILRSDYEMQEDDIIRYFEALEERKAGKPIQYLIKHQEFMGLSFYVDERVLIPRPDTENLVEAVLAFLKPLKSPRILDLCTGSGAIAIALAHFREDAQVTGTDVSHDALEVAENNGKRLLGQGRVRWLQGNLLEAVADDKEFFDVIVSNPPYIPTAEIEKLEPNVKAYEPYSALDGGVDGLDFYRVLVSGVARRLKSGGLLGLEIGFDQGISVVKLIEETGFYKQPWIVKDLAGHDRVVMAEKS